MEITLTLQDLNKNMMDFLSTVDHTPFYRQVGKILLSATMDNFESDGAYFNRGTDWAPLADSTIKERTRLNFMPLQILRRRAGDAGLLGSINYTADDNGVELGTNIFYAKYLHFGVPGRMPARPIFPENELPPEVIEDIADAYERFMKRVLPQ